MINKNDIFTNDIKILNFLILALQGVFHNKKHSVTWCDTVIIIVLLFANVQGRDNHCGVLTMSESLVRKHP